MTHKRTLAEIVGTAAIASAAYVGGNLTAEPLPIGEYIPAIGESFSGPLYKEPHDADTLKILVRKKGVVTVRVNEIDPPEADQPGGPASTAYLLARIARGELQATATGRDRYCRTLADVRLPDGRKLADELVRAGHAWHYAEYSKSKELAELQREAQRDRRGLWAGKNPIEPKLWRAGRR